MSPSPLHFLKYKQFSSDLLQTPFSLYSECSVSWTAFILSFSSQPSHTGAVKRTYLMSLSSRPRPCQSARASSNVSGTCLSSSSPRTFPSFYQSFSALTSSPLFLLPPHGSKSYRSFAPLTVRTPSTPAPLAKVTADQSPFLLPQTHFSLCSLSQSCSGDSSSRPHLLCQDTIQVSAASHTSKQKCTRPMQSHESTPTLQTRTCTSCRLSRFPSLPALATLSRPGGFRQASDQNFPYFQLFFLPHQSFLGQLQTYHRAITIFSLRPYLSSH